MVTHPVAGGGKRFSFYRRSSEVPAHRLLLAMLTASVGVGAMGAKVLPIAGTVNTRLSCGRGSSGKGGEGGGVVAQLMQVTVTKARVNF